MGSASLFPAPSRSSALSQPQQTCRSRLALFAHNVASLAEPCKHVRLTFRAPIPSEHLRRSQPRGLLSRPTPPRPAPPRPAPLEDWGAPSPLHLPAPPARAQSRRGTRTRAGVAGPVASQAGAKPQSQLRTLQTQVRSRTASLGPVGLGALGKGASATWLRQSVPQLRCGEFQPDLPPASLVPPFLAIGSTGPC